MHNLDPMADSLTMEGCYLNSVLYSKRQFKGTAFNIWCVGKHIWLPSGSDWKAESFLGVTSGGPPSASGPWNLSDFISCSFPSPHWPPYLDMLSLGPFHRLFPLPRRFSPQISAWIISSPPSGLCLSRLNFSILFQITTCHLLPLHPSPYHPYPWSLHTQQNSLTQSVSWSLSGWPR